MRKEQSLGRLVLAFLLTWGVFVSLSHALKARQDAEFKACIERTSISDADCEECYIKTYGRMPDKK